MKHTVKKSASLLDTVLELYHGVSKQKAKQIISNSVFMKNGDRLASHPKEMLEVGDVIEVMKTEKGVKQPKPPTRARPFAIYYEDEYLLAALKPAGILASFDRNRPKDNSFQMELQNFLDERDHEGKRLWVVHQLDREVEGLMLFALSEPIQQKMIRHWHDVSMKYLAITEKKPSPTQGVIENWIHETTLRKLAATKEEVPESKFVKTSYELVRQQGRFFVVEVTVESGKAKQIRLHLSDLGCTIAGDRKYGDNSDVLRQLRLAANFMEFKHPVTGLMVSLSYVPAPKFFSPSNKENELYKIL